jgi:hypothetical protein
MAADWDRDGRIWGLKQRSGGVSSEWRGEGDWGNGVEVGAGSGGETARRRSRKTGSVKGEFFLGLVNH